MQWRKEHAVSVINQEHQGRLQSIFLQNYEILLTVKWQNSPSHTPKEE